MGTLQLNPEANSVPDQCDQMDNFFIQYLVIYNNEHLPKAIKVDPSRFKLLPSIK